MIETVETVDNYLAAAIEMATGEEGELRESSERRNQFVIVFEGETAKKAKEMKQEYHAGMLGINNLRKFRRHVKDLRDRIDDLSADNLYHHK